LIALVGREGFRGLKVWQKGKELAVFVYQITGSGSFTSDYGLRDQIRRAAVSVPSNIAEGDGLGSDRQAVRYLNMARGSTSEIITQAAIAFEIGYINSNIFEELESRCTEIMKMLSKLISSKSNV
jgi:four helix bundle protein